MPGIFSQDLIYCTLKIKSRRQEKYITIRNFKRIKIEALKHDFNSIKWNAIYQANDVNEKVKFFNNKIIGLHDKHAPYKKVKFTRKAALWVDEKNKP